MLWPRNLFWTFILVIISVTCKASLNFGETVIREKMGEASLVIDEADLKRLSPAELTDILRTIPGFQISQNGGAGQFAAGSLQGGGSERILVLFDGIRVNDPTSTSGAFDFSTLDPRLISKIEILYGPQSVKYGSGALAGVVLITSKNLVSTNWLFEGGSNSFHRELFGFGQQNERSNFSVQAFNKRVEGPSSASELAGNTEQDSYGQQGVILKSQMYLDSDLLITSTIFHSQSKYASDSGAGPGKDDQNNTSSARQTTAGVSAQKEFSDKAKGRITFTTMQNERGYLDPSVFSSYYEGNFFEAKSEFSYQFSKVALILFGVDASSESVKISEGTDLNKNNSTADIFSRGVFDFESFQIFLGLRGEKTLGLIGEAGVKTELNTYTEMNFQLSRGSKRPTLYQLYSSSGEPGLETERLDSRQFQLKFEHILFGEHQLNIFQNNFENLITYDLTTSRFRNYEKVETQGIQGRSIIRAAQDDRFEYAWTYLEAKDQITKENLYRKPRFNDAFSWVHDWQDNIDSVVAARTIGEREDQSNTGRTKLPTVAIFDFRVGYKWDQQVDISFKIVNVLDQNYEETWGYTSLGRSYFLTLQSVL